MKVVKKINNNVVGCIDDNGNELVAFGKGIGFPKIPYELTDLSRIERTFYGVSPQYLGLVREIPQDVFHASAAIVDYAVMHLDHELSPNVVFTIADHINFAIERTKKGLIIRQPYVGNLAYLHEKEYEIGEWALKYISQHLHIHLAKEEAASIALHFINAEIIAPKEHAGMDEETAIYEITSRIEKELGITIDRRGFNYSRFVTHLQYLLKRIEKKENIEGGSSDLLPGLKERYPEIYACALNISDDLEKQSGVKLSEDEIVYLMLHITRLASREETRKG